MTQPSLLIPLPRHLPVSVVSVRPRQCSVCLSHDQRLKFKTSPLESGPQPPSILVDGNAVDSLSTFTYLGSLQSSDGYCRPDVRRRITLASSVMLSLDCIWKERRLPLPIKIGLRVDLALVESVLLYAPETWTVTSADAKSLEAFHMKCQRRMLIVSWRQFVRNSEISALTGLHAINDVIRHRRIAVSGHIARLQDSTPAHNALQSHVRQPLTQSSSPCLLQLSARRAWSPTWQLDRPNPKRHQPDTYRPLETDPWMRSSWTSDIMAHAGYAMKIMMRCSTSPTGFRNYNRYLDTPNHK